MSPARTPLRLDPEACDTCGRCVGACKKGALRVGPGYILVDWSRCDGCGKCADLCDREAIVLRDARAGRETGAAGAAVAAVAPSAPAVDESPAWTLPEGVLVLVVSFALLIGIQSLFGAASGMPGTAGLVLVAYDSGLLALLAFFVIRRGVSPFRAFRLDAAPEAGSLLLALALFVGLRLLVVGYSIAASASGFSPPTGEGANLATLFGSGPLGALTTILVVAVLGPVLEEAALRGVLLGALRERIGPWPAVLVTALAFSLLHVSGWSFLPLTVLGVALGWLAVRSRSLWPAIVLHVAYNALILASAFRAAGPG
jgi:membrane protease YdiL (CAAX protease family)/NAD-dependent dihydropyrimidine dehydrogenase PreA subunit